MRLHRIREIVERNDTPAGKTFDLFIQALIVLSLVSFSVETLPNLTAQTQDTLYAIEAVTVGIYYFEREAQPEAFGSVFHSLWWALTTLTTVGYGDMYPVTVGGKLFTSFVLLIGLAVIAVPCGLVASSLAEARRLEAEEEKEL